ncbi:phospholipase [Erwinia psidii]|uniref:alpha/beta hydrolase n=1 Tax=Erwinia psidii TaxID=69224 RepID=UPI00226B9FE2|nr:prolyl oligopeptidase family serine peptidase [Erwinia psidii]MCX8961219.1 phospholipase [Erwinia psidii]
MKKRLVILLHGVGSNGEDLANLGTYWATGMPGLGVASPNAPFHFEHGAGWQWFSLTDITLENRPERVVQARDAFDAVINATLARHQMQHQLDHVILAGFSQGAIMALDALVSGRWPVAGVVAFSGRLASPPPYNAVKDTPVLLIHGRADDVIPCAESETAAATLRELGIRVSSHFEPDTGHTISAQGAADAAAFIASCLSE